MAINEFLTKRWDREFFDKQSKPSHPHEPTWLIWWWFLLLGTLFWAIIAVTFFMYFQNSLIVDDRPFVSWFLCRYIF